MYLNSYEVLEEIGAEYTSQHIIFERLRKEGFNIFKARYALNNLLINKQIEKKRDSMGFIYIRRVG